MHGFRGNFSLLRATFLSLAAIASSCNSADHLTLRGEKAGKKSDSQESAATAVQTTNPSNNNGSSSTHSDVQELRDVSLYFANIDPAKASEIPVGRLCSNVMTRNAQTNFFMAEKGVDIVFVDPSGKKMAISAGDLSNTLLADVLDDGKLKIDFQALGVPDGDYTIGFCDSKFPQCKEGVLFADGQYLATHSANAQSAARALIGRIRVGLFGIVGGLKITDGKGVSAGGAVLLNVNLAIRQRTNIASQAIYSQRDSNSVIRQRLANDAVSTSFVAQVMQQPASTPTPTTTGGSDDPRANDAEDCDASASPLVLDFGNDGVFSGKPSMVAFDLTARGHVDSLISTLSSDDYLLAMDRNHNGKIDDGRELFGNYTQDSKQSTSFANGFAALAALDSNHDNVIDAKDAEFKNLRLWQMGSKRLLSLKDKGVQAISLNYTIAVKGDVHSGNTVREVSSFIAKDGKHPIVDLWYQVGKESLVRK